MVDRNVAKFSGEEAYNLMCRGDIFTDGELYYRCGVTRRKDGILIKIIQVYESLMQCVDPIAFILPKKWIDETKQSLWKAYMTSEEATLAMSSGHAVMDSNGYVYSSKVIVSPLTGVSRNMVLVYDGTAGAPQKIFTEEQFEKKYQEDRYFIIYSKEGWEITDD